MIIFEALFTLTTNPCLRCEIVCVKYCIHKKRIFSKDGVRSGFATISFQNNFFGRVYKDYLKVLMHQLQSKLKLN